MILKYFLKKLFPPKKHLYKPQVGCKHFYNYLNTFIPSSFFPPPNFLRGCRRRVAREVAERRPVAFAVVGVDEHLDRLLDELEFRCRLHTRLTLSRLVLLSLLPPSSSSSTDLALAPTVREDAR